MVYNMDFLIAAMVILLVAKKFLVPSGNVKLTINVAVHVRLT